MAGAISFYHPGKRFPAFSVTGGRCELQCDHCRGRYLLGMRPVGAPEELEKAALSLVSEGGKGFLLSGGCDRRGRVPLSPYLDTVRRIRERNGLLVNLHAGLLDEGTAYRLLGTGADALSVDVLQDPLTISGVLHLDASPRDYARTLELLSRSGRLVPHVCVGLQSEAGEDATLDLLSSIEVAALIVLGLVPSKGTPLEGVPPRPERLVRFLSRAVERIDAPVLLGCMRPRGDPTVEERAIEAGVAGIVNPSSQATAYAVRRGLRIENRETCCAHHR
jgi:lipoyl synthase